MKQQSLPLRLLPYALAVGVGLILGYVNTHTDEVPFVAVVDGRLGGNREGERRFGHSLDVSGDEPMGSEIDDAVIAERRVLDVGLARIAAEMDIVKRRAKLLRHSLEFVGCVGKLRQGLPQSAFINARPLPEIGERARREITRNRLVDGALGRDIA